MPKLSKTDEMRMKKIKWRKVNGLYFSKFETKEEAYLFLKKIARRYAHSDAYTNKVKDLVKECQEDGIMLYPTQLGRWLKEVFGLNIEYKRSDRNRKYHTTLSYDLEVHKILKLVAEKVGMYNKSEFVNALLRHHCGLDIKELILYLGDIDENPVSVMFYKNYTGDTQAVYMGWLPTTDRKFIESLCHDADEHGMDYIKRKCRTLGYFCYGLTKKEDNNNE